MSIFFSKLRSELRLSTELQVSRSTEEVFDFFSDPKNLEKLTPTFLKFKINNQNAINMKTGELIDYELRVRGLPLRWTSIISTWDPPYCFVDEQIKGPYRYWIHKHTFEKSGNYTIIRDFVRYQVFGGKLVHELFVKKDLYKIFSYREKTLKKIFD